MMTQLKGTSGMAGMREFSTEAIALATLQLTHGLFRQLVESKVFTEGQVSDIFHQSIAIQRASSLPCNEEAADLLESMAKSRISKWR